MPSSSATLPASSSDISAAYRLVGRDARRHRSLRAAVSGEAGADDQDLVGIGAVGQAVATARVVCVGAVREDQDGGGSGERRGEEGDEAHGENGGLVVTVLTFPRSEWCCCCCGVWFF